MNGTTQRIAVIGGGLTGLSAAFYARQTAKQQGLNAEITLIEGSNRYGGKVMTLRKDGCVIERGPDSFLARKLPMIELARELGIDNEIVAVNPQARTFVYQGDQLHRMPQGLVLGIPTQLGPFARTKLISPLGKARAALDFVLPRRKASSDEALGTFFRRRLGGEVLERIAEPLLAGIYAGDTDRLSLQATFPQFGQMEREHRSIMLGMMRSKALRQAPRDNPDLPSVAKGAMFLTFKNGLETVIDALTIRLRDIRWISGNAAVAVDKAQGGAGNLVRLEDGSVLEFDAVIIATPNFAAAKIIKPLADVANLIDIPYASVSNVVLAYRRSEVQDAMKGSGFVVARTEDLTITACTLTSIKWPHTTPADLALVRCYVGRFGDDRGIVLDDDELVARVRTDLRRTLNIKAEPLFIEPTRWPRAMPQYTVGHLERLAAYRDRLKAALPGVYIAGSGYEGVGLPDCIVQGKLAAESSINFLRK